jgi:uncharacterized peroxidase-related enzyme
MLDYAVKLTREPWAMMEQDVVRLRGAGFTDADILDIAQIVAYFAYANRIADGLGIMHPQIADPAIPSGTSL